MDRRKSPRRLLALVEGGRTVPHLAPAIRQAVATGDPVIFVVDGPSDREEIFREEQFHRAKRQQKSTVEARLR